MNLIHSLDGYMVREVSRRTNYNRTRVMEALNCIEYQLVALGLDTAKPMKTKGKEYVMSVVHIERDHSQYEHWDSNQLLRLREILLTMLESEPAEVICIHDAFKAHPNHCNTIRYWYKEILAELAESDILSQLFTEIAGEEVEYENVRGGYTKEEMSALIRKSNYAIC